MERPQILGFHHVCIVASDCEKSRKFYVDDLGMDVFHETYSRNRNAKKYVLYYGGQYMIELFARDAVPEQELKQDDTPGIEHVSFYVSDVGEMLDYLRRRGAEVSDVKCDRDTDKEYGFCWDPDHNKIEFYEK